MNNAIAKIAASITNGTVEDLINMNDAAVNEVRNFADSKGYNAAALVAEETARIDTGSMDLIAYLTCSRVGSFRQLNRAVRCDVFVAIMSRRALGR